MINNTPRISFVVTSRNDNHGGDLLRRMQLSVSALLEQCHRYNLSSELIIVEWNPPPERPPLIDALRWPKNPGPCDVRIITVPPEIHRGFKYSDKLPLFQMIAKNVGIRRARGEYILATNIDVLFSNELMRFLSEAKLDPDGLYRLDRWDVSPNIPDEASLDEQLEFCRRNVLRINVRKGTIINPKEIRTIQYLSEAGLSYDGMVATLIGRKFHLPEFTPLKNFQNRLTPFLDWISFWFRMPIKRRLSVLVTPAYWKKIFVWLLAIFFPPKAPRETTRTCRLKSRPNERKSLSIADLYALHTNACGDFTLLSRDRWFRIRGYPEWEMYSFHIDSLGVYAARIDGAKEIVLKSSQRFYHIEHASGWTPEQNDELYGRMGHLGVPMLTYVDLMKETEKFYTHGIDYNKEDWGLMNAKLREVRVSRESQLD